MHGFTWRDMPPGVRKFVRGQVLVCAGDPAETVFVLKAGHVRTFLLSEDGQDTTTGILSAPQIVNISPLLGRPMYDAFAEALDCVEAWAWPADRLLQLLLVDRELLGFVVRALTQRLALEVALLGDVALVDVSDRLQGVQLRFADQATAQHAITHRALAQLIGARPETVSRSLHRCRTESSDAADARPLSAVTGSPSEAPRCPAPRVLSCVAGERIVRPEPRGQSLFFVLDGTVRLFLEDHRGRQVSVDRVQANEYFGLPALVEAAAPALAAEALTDVRLSIVDPASLLRLLERKPQLAWALMGQVGARIERVEQRLRRAHGVNACTRIANLLEELADQEGEVQSDGSRLLPAGWTHVALGREVGLCRETVTRALRALAAEGRVRQHGRRLLVGGARTQ
jgi:CRP/FNR family cyclic AMP-dependent transcriptional regulator